MKISAGFITMCAQIRKAHAVLIWSTATVLLCICFCSVLRPHCFLFFPAEVKTFSLYCKQNSSWKVILFTQKCFPAFTLGEQKAVSSVKDLDWGSFGERPLQCLGSFLTHHFNGWSTQHDEYVQGSSASLLCGFSFYMDDYNYKCIIGLKNNLIQGKWKTKIININPKWRVLLKITVVFLVLPNPVFSNKLGTNLSQWPLPELEDR